MHRSKTGSRLLSTCGVRAKPSFFGSNRPRHACGVPLAGRQCGTPDRHTPGEGVSVTNVSQTNDRNGGGFSLTATEIRQIKAAVANEAYPPQGRAGVGTVVRRAG